MATTKDYYKVLGIEKNACPSVGACGGMYTANTMASAIANQFNEADNELYFSAVVGVAAILLVVSALVKLFARFLIWSITRNAAQGARA